MLNGKSLVSENTCKIPLGLFQSLHLQNLLILGILKIITFFFRHWQHSLSESAINQSADLINDRVITKMVFYQKGQQVSGNGQLVEFFFFFFFKTSKNSFVNFHKGGHLRQAAGYDSNRACQSD